MEPKRDGERTIQRATKHTVAFAVCLLAVIGFAATCGAAAAYGITAEIRLRALERGLDEQAVEIKRLRRDLAAYRAGPPK